VTDNPTAEFKRKRGVRVSSAKLQHALAQSDLKTQTAVAERIADNESLESAPRGLVNKVFRGESVDPRSIERVAKALDVEAWTLYASSSEQASTNVVELVNNKTSSVEAPKPKKTVMLWLTTIACVFVLIVTALILWQVKQPKAERQSTKPPIAVQQNPSAQQTVIVLPFNGSRGVEFTEKFSKALSKYWRIVPNRVYQDSTLPSPQALLSDKAIDRVVETRISVEGRWLGIAMYLHQSGAMNTAWLGSVRTQASEQEIERLMNQASKAITAGNIKLNGSQEAQTKYLAGRKYLDRARTELNVRRALTEFESALRLDSGYVEAYAGLCEALVVENTRTGDISLLEEAAPQCTKALSLAPDNLSALKAKANLDRKRGQLVESLAGFEQVLVQTPGNVDALLGIAEVHLTRYSRSEDSEGYIKAVAAVEQSKILDPDFWKTHYSLARIQFIGADLEAAVAASEQAVELEANLQTLNNLGVYQFCLGNFEQARDAYVQARQVDTNEFISDQQLAVIHYTLEEIDEAVSSYETALQAYQQSGQVADYRFWGNYAAALRRQGRSDDALNAFVKAVTLTEKAISEGDGRPIHRAARAFFYEVLGRLYPDQLNQQLIDMAELDELSKARDPLASLYLSIVYKLRNFENEAKRLQALGTAGCPGLVLTLDVEPLLRS